MGCTKERERSQQVMPSTPVAALEEYVGTHRDSTPPRETDDRVTVRARRSYSRLESSARLRFWFVAILNIAALALISYFVFCWIPAPH